MNSQYPTQSGSDREADNIVSLALHRHRMEKKSAVSEDLDGEVAATRRAVSDEAKALCSAAFRLYELRKVAG